MERKFGEAMTRSRLHWNIQRKCILHHPALAAATLAQRIPEQHHQQLFLDSVEKCECNAPETGTKQNGFALYTLIPKHAATMLFAFGWTLKFGTFAN